MAVSLSIHSPELDEVRATDAARAAALRPEAPVFSLGDAYGLLGEWTHLWAPHTEASPVAIYACALAAMGALIGRGPKMWIGTEWHHSRKFVLLIGLSGRGRKGTALNVGITQLLEAVDPDFARTRMVSGLSSAEGLISEVRDATPPIIDDNGKTIFRGDPGISDKRLLVLEREFGGALESMARDGNRLSAIIRDAWDGATLRSLVKRDPQRATDPHIAIVGAITSGELRSLLKRAGVLNGLASRFLPIWSARVQLLPESTSPDPRAVQHLVQRIQRVVFDARKIGIGKLTPDAAELWKVVYTDLSLTEDASDVVRTLLERGAPYVRRIAFTLALLDGSGAVGVAHMNAALALWRYAADTWRHVYSDGAAHSPLAIKILAALTIAGPSGLTRSEIRGNAVRSNAVPAERIVLALQELLASGLVERLSEPTGGRAIERWRHSRFLGQSF